LKFGFGQNRVVEKTLDSGDESGKVSRSRVSTWNSVEEHEQVEKQSGELAVRSP
jgi:hypothetical protein